jgi:flagellar biosynthesis protein FlhG
VNKYFDQAHYYKATPDEGPYILAVASGKGGVGKSFISSSLAICFSRMAHKVTLVDLDLGSANVHTYFGAKPPQHSFTDFLKDRVDSFQYLSSPTNLPNLDIISGCNDSFDIANISEGEQARILKGVRSLNSDVVILDLGAGTTNATLDFFGSADMSLLALTPEPTAIENVYRFMKSAFYRKVQVTSAGTGVQSLIDNVMDQQNAFGIKSPKDLMQHLANTNQLDAHRFLKDMEQFNLGIILNQVRSGRDIDVGRGVSSISKNYFGIPVRYLGHIAYDNAVWQSLRKKKPLLIDHPTSPVNNQIFAIAKLILGPQHKKAVV